MIKKLLNPFAYFDDKLLLIIGLIAHLFFSYICYLTDSYFPDFLSIQKIKIDFSFVDIIYQNTRNVLIAILLLYFYGKFINPKTRFIDIINVVLISRITYYIVFITDFIPFINQKINKVTEGVLSNDLTILQNPSIMITVVIVGFFALFCMAIMFYYLYRGFKTVTNLKNTKQTLGYIAVIFLLILSTTILALIIPQKL